MPIADALFLSAVVLAFVIFAVLLAWGDYQTHNLRGPASGPARKVSAQQKPENAGIAAGGRVKEGANS